MQAIQQQKKPTELRRSITHPNLCLSSCCSTVSLLQGGRTSQLLRMNCCRPSDSLDHETPSKFHQAPPTFKLLLQYLPQHSLPFVGWPSRFQCLQQRNHGIIRASCKAIERCLAAIKGVKKLHKTLVSRVWGRGGEPRELAGAWGVSNTVRKCYICQGVSAKQGQIKLCCCGCFQQVCNAAAVSITCRCECRTQEKGVEC